MKTKLIKRIIAPLLFAFALASMVVATAQGTSDTARADSPAVAPCGVQTLHGSYVFNAHGWNVVSGAAVPKAILEGINFNGDGTLVSPFVTLSVNGTIIRTSGTTGTYTVQSDCTGTLSFDDGNSFDVFVSRNGQQLWMIQTISVGGTPAVFEGTGRRVGP